MRISLALASSFALALLGCGDADTPVADADPGAYEAPDAFAGAESPAGEAPQPGADVAAGPPAAELPAAPGKAEADVEIARRIREKLVSSDQPLSSEAQSVDVSVEQGAVTLRGPVENTREKELVVAIVGSVEGVTKVEDRLEIASR